jgi:hypothetical protein
MIIDLQLRSCMYFLCTVLSYLIIICFSLLFLITRLMFCNIFVYFIFVLYFFCIL